MLGPQELVQTIVEATRPSPRPELVHRLAWGAVLLLSIGLFFLVGRQSSFLDIDSGPYLSMAHHTRTSGVPRSSFLFVGGAPTLPALANFAPPGVGFIIGVVALVSGDVMTGAQGLLALALLVAATAAFLLARRYANPVFSGFAAALLVSSPVMVHLAALVLSELPFMAAVLLATWSGARVLAQPGDRRRWLVLGLLAAPLPLLRYLGLFFVPGFLLAFLIDRKRRSQHRAHALRLAGIVAFGWLPLVLWFLTLWASGVPLLPQRPPALLGWGKAISGAVAYLSAWSWPFLVGAVLVWAWSRFGRPRVPAEPGANTDDVRLPAILLLSYVAVLLVSRTRESYYPLEEIGQRYMAPAWPLVFVAGVAAFHRWVWVRCSTREVLVTALAACTGLVFCIAVAAKLRLPETFPAGTATFSAAVAALPEESVVLSSFGQQLTAHRPRVLVLGLPSKEDFLYHVDLASLAEQYDLGWVVLFKVDKMERLYGEEVAGWLEQPPQGVTVLGRTRLADGVIYHISKAH